MIKTITILTGNKRKEKGLKKIFEDLGIKIKIEIENPWLPEIQDSDTANVASFAARYGADLLKKPIIKMDSGFSVEELSGFPGTLVHSVDEQVGTERFFEILKNLKNRKAWIENSLAYCRPNKKPIIFKSKCKGVIVKQLLDSEGSFIDRLFIPYHSKNKELKTIGQIRKENPELFSEMWGDAELQFAKWLAGSF